MKAKEFYFNEVTVKREENPHELLDFELVSDNVLKLFVDGTKKVGKSSITLNKKECTFPDSIEWDIHNNSINRITLRVETVDVNDNILDGFWMTLTPNYINNVIFNYISKDTQKILITCYRQNVIGKTATLTVTSKN